MVEVKEGRIIEEEGVTFLFFDPEGKTFLLEIRPLSDKKFGGLTVVPGGSIEEGETQSDTLVREITEELGVGVTIEEAICLGGFCFFNGEGSYCKSHSYLIFYDGAIENKELDKGTHIIVDAKDAEKVVELSASKYIIRLANTYLRQHT